MIPWQGFQALPQAEDALQEFTTEKIPSPWQYLPPVLMAVYGMLGSAVPTGFLEGAFLPAIIVLVLMCIFINLGKNRK